MLSAIVSFESRMAFSNFITCLSCIQMKNGVSPTKTKNPQKNKMPPAPNVVNRSMKVSCSFNLT